MKLPIPRIDETPVALKRLLEAKTEAQRHQRVQALYILQTQPAHTRRQVARLLGVSRNTMGRWLVASEVGGLTQMLTIAKAPGNTPPVPPAVRRALTQRMAPPPGFPSYKAIWHWRQHEYGLAIAYNTVIGSSAIDCRPN
jgi:hypothetical protein